MKKIAVLIIVMVCIYAVISCKKKQQIIVDVPALTYTATITPPENTVTLTATITNTSTPDWILAGSIVPAGDAHYVHTESRGNTIYVAYQQGAGLAKQLNVKMYSVAGGWQDYSMNIATSYAGGNPWFEMGLMSMYVVVVDSAGYVYVYYDFLYNKNWVSLGTNPIAGPNCTEVGICSDYENSGFESIYVFYTDGNDDNILKSKRMETYLSTVNTWQDVGIYPGPHRTYKINETGTFNVESYDEPLSRNYFMIFADADANTMVSIRELGGTNYDFTNVGAATFTTVGPPSYLDASFIPGGFPFMAYSDAGLGGRAVVKKKVAGTWYDVGGGPASAGQAKYISLACKNVCLLAYADATAGNAIVLKQANEAEWVDLGLPAETVESISAGIFNNPSYNNFVAYTTGASDGYKLKLMYMK